MPSLADKLKALGVKVGAADLPVPQADRRHGIDALVPGCFRQTRRGEVFVAEQIFPSDYRHGAALIVPASPLSVIAQWADDARIEELPLASLAFLDTETSGLAGGTGTYAFMVGVARFVDDQFQLAQFFLRDPSEEPALLEGLTDFLAPCRALVTFNGKTFDAPLLRTRFTLHHIPNPFADFAHIDLLPLARRLWRDRLPSRALKYLEENILGLPRTSEEVPGYEIPWLYFDYLRTGDASPLKGVFYHNAMDVVTMAALLSHVNDMLADPFSGRVEHGLDFVALGKLFEDLGRWDEAAKLYERGLESNLTESDFGVAVKRHAILQKRRGDVTQAIRWWEQAAERGHIYACIELAKHYEHRERDPQQAMHWAQTARDLVNGQDLPPYMRQHWLGEIGHRLSRLERKTGS
ncbi:MAG: ribonuclease H-like domain-containing protein [Chloroflexi bacterium]|nr:ribonuclease H-like domain-containing protein [Chloroflexota bacterium]